MRTATAIAGVAGLLVTGAAGYTLATVLDDPDVAVDTVSASGFATPTTTSPAGGPPTTTAAETVAGLEQLAGVLVEGDDPDDWALGGVDLDFGPEVWLVSGATLDDIDGDGTVEAVLEELRGLAGSEVVVGVRFEVDDDRDDADVFTIDGHTFRDPSGGPAQWELVAGGPAATREEVAAAAAAAVGWEAVAEDVERADDGAAGWEVEVRGADGREYRVLLDDSGAILDVRPDD